MCNSKAQDFSTLFKFEMTTREERLMPASVKIVFTRSILGKRDIIIKLELSLISPSNLTLFLMLPLAQKKNFYHFWGRVSGKRVSRKPPKFSVDSPGSVSGGSEKTVENLHFKSWWT